jgi:RHS repeat-associated protein
MDLVIGPNSSGQWFVLRSTGTSFEDLSNNLTTPWPSVYGGAWADVASMSRIRPVDANNDGLTDILLGPDHAGTWYLLQSTGSGFINGGAWLTIPEIASTAWDLPESQGRIRQIDVNGDGRQDVLVGPDSSGNWWIGGATVPYPDLLSAIQNGYGGSASIAYTPSTRFQQVLLPFAIQVPTSVTVNDGTGAPAASATTEYQYFNGYFLLRDREFRGFAQTTVLGQPWPGGARARTTTFFRQGNGYDPTASGILDAAADDPSQSPGYARGMPWKVVAEDTASSAFSVTETRNKVVAGAPSYFVPATDVRSKYCSSANVCGRQSRQTMEYADGYGNVTREDHYGDINDSTDDFTIQRVFALNTTDWIIGLPARETTYAGAGAVPGNRIAEINFDYDGTTTDCAIHPVRTPIPPPIRGNRTRVSSWLDTGPSNPETVMSYDSYGNVVCSRDPLGNITRTAYDSTRTFSVSATNVLGHVATSKYYGVDGVPWSSSALDPGLYGYVQSTTDPNLATTSFQYDVFGRKKSETGPDNFTTTWSYNTLGTVGRRGFAEGQNQGVSSSAGMSETYFDGLGRITLKRGRGSATAPWIAEQYDYLATASLGSKSEPFFHGTETARFTTYAYDVNGRPVSVTAPDGSVVTTCRDDMVGVTVVVDPNKHRRRETRDVNGRVRRIEEYLGTFATCTTDVGTPYATTLYSSDVLGRMTQITPAKGQPIGMTYDSLGRKRSNSDPHLGTWTYGYDANGNLVTQVDQRGATSSFQYDPLNRPITKTVTLNTVTPPPPTLSVTYKYDLGPFGIGRLSQRTESSGSNVTGSIALSYDNLGRVVSSTQAIGSRGFTTSASFDAARRPLTITFPDGVVVTSAYDAQGRLAQLSDPTRVYANFPANRYDAYGRAGTINFGDGTISSYTFEPSSARLRRILTTTSTSAPLLDLTYQYDLVGSITAILDGVDSSASQSFAYDELNRLVRAQSSSYASAPATLSYAYDVTRVQSLTSTSDGRNYSYDPNGNLVGDGQRTLVWDPENRLASVTLGAATTTLTYDDAGARLKKDGSSGTVLYASAQFECATPPGGVETCTRYIVGNGIRLASVAGTTVRYFHLDHLGSTRVVTSAQEVVERASYRPFGLTLSDTASGGSRQKFSAKELDAETGLYNYGARYYDPALGRFVSADSVLQSVLDPQLLNRYAYARNNPVLLADPSGHFVIAPFLAAVIIGAVVGGVSAGIASNWNLDQMWKGALVGAVGAAAGYGLGPVVGKVLGDGVVAVIAGGAICGAATGATAGGLAAGLAGGNVLAGMGQGALYGAIGGAIGGGFRTIPGLKALPNAAASTAGSAITGFIECGPGCAARSAASSLASSMAMDLNAAFGPRTEERLSQLNSRTAQLARQHLALIANDPVLAEGGYSVTLGDTYRTSEQQLARYRDGGGAPPGRSYHEFRAAYDLNIVDANGRFVSDPQDPGLIRMGQLGLSVGLQWGGRFTTRIDMYHFEFSGGVPIGVFRARYQGGLDPYTGGH